MAPEITTNLAAWEEPTGNRPISLPKVRLETTPLNGHGMISYKRNKNFHLKNQCGINYVYTQYNEFLIDKISALTWYHKWEL